VIPVTAARGRTHPRIGPTVRSGQAQHG